MDTWIEAQFAAGKKDDDIVETLVKNGWHLRDAQYAVRMARIPLKLTAEELDVAILALVGIFLGIAVLLDLSGYAAFSAISLFTSAVITASIALLLWTLYDLSIKHCHPKLHKGFFLLASVVVGAGIFLLLLSVGIIFFVLTKLTLYTLVLAVLLGIIFTVSVLMTEYSYVGLRDQYEEIPPKNKARLAYWGAGIGVLCAIIMLVAIWQAENAAVRNVNSMTADLQSRAVQLFERIDETAIANPFLRERVGAHLASLKEPTQPMPQATFAETVQDAVVLHRCEQYQQAIKTWAASNDAVVIKSYPEFHALNITNLTYTPRKSTMQPIDASSLSFAVKYKPLSDFQNCMRGAIVIINDEYSYDLQVTNTSDPAQQDVLQYYAWTQMKR